MYVEDIVLLQRILTSATVCLYQRSLTTLQMFSSVQNVRIFGTPSLPISAAPVLLLVTVNRKMLTFTNIMRKEWYNVRMF